MTEAAFAPQDAAALLRWYVDHGIDETIGEEAIDRFALPPPAAVVAAPAASAGPVSRARLARLLRRQPSDLRTTDGNFERAREDSNL